MELVFVSKLGSAASAQEIAQGMAFAQTAPASATLDFMGMIAPASDRTRRIQHSHVKAIARGTVHA